MKKGSSGIRLVTLIFLNIFIFWLLFNGYEYFLQICLLGAAYDEFIVIVSRASLPKRLCSFLNNMVFCWAASKGLPLLTMALIGSLFLSMISAIIKFEASGKKTIVLSDFHQLVTEMFGLVYISFFYSFSYLLGVESGEDGNWWITYTIICAGLGDAGALIVGKLIGHTKIVPKISPNKTLEGLISCIITSTLSSGPVAWACGFTWTIEEAAILGSLMGISCLIGDLFESILKRSYGVKDTGWLLPGMGGVLDRLDSFLIAFPINYYAWLFYFSQVNSNPINYARS